MDSVLIVLCTLVVIVAVWAVIGWRSDRAEADRMQRQFGEYCKVGDVFYREVKSGDGSVDNLSRSYVKVVNKVEDINGKPYVEIVDQEGRHIIYEYAKFLWETDYYQVESDEWKQ